MDSPNLRELATRFEAFITSLFEQQGFTVVQPKRFERGHDFMVYSGKALAVVEVKLYSSLEPARRNIQQALELLELSRRRNNANFGVLATNSRLLTEHRSQLERFPNLKVFDFDILSALAAPHLPLALEFAEITRGALVFRGEDLPTAQPVEALQMVSELASAARPVPEPLSGPTPEPLQIGAQLCASVRNVKKGVSKPFEEACEAAIRYLFEDQLIAFDRQHHSHSKLHVFDLVARIASKEAFWQALISDFRARYIVFEFKNYKKKITQREIYTTEKYLYPIAMRGAAIIISRFGADAGADQAMRGALRENGKLILSLSIDELCEMLGARDSGSDHLVTLVDKLDGMLMGLER